LLAAVHRPQQHACADAQQGQVGEHLDHEHDPGGLGFGGDIAEAHRGEDGHAEVQGVGAGQRLGEVARRGPLHQEVRRGEQQQVQGNDQSQRLGRPQARVAREGDRFDLSYRQAREDQQADQQAPSGAVIPRRDAAPAAWANSAFQSNCDMSLSPADGANAEPIPVRATGLNDVAAPGRFTPHPGITLGEVNGGGRGNNSAAAAVPTIAADSPIWQAFT